VEQGTLRRERGFGASTQAQDVGGQDGGDLAAAFACPELVERVKTPLGLGRMHGRLLWSLAPTMPLPSEVEGTSALSLSEGRRCDVGREDFLSLLYAPSEFGTSKTRSGRYAVARL
jgi:hypothetical protein